MSVEASAERVVSAPPDAVAAVMFDPLHYARWMKAVERVEPLPAAGGRPARVRLTARFLGRRIAWETELIDRRADRLHLRIPAGAFRGEVIYEVLPAPEGSRVRITNRGEAPVFRFLPRRMLERAMGKALGEDLERLAALVADRAGGSA